MAFATCPLCNRRFLVEEAPHMPFCSLRCKQIDLGRWLDERYGLPYEGDDEPDEYSADD